jgi:hypothetical protein
VKRVERKQRSLSTLPPAPAGAPDGPATSAALASATALRRRAPRAWVFGFAFAGLVGACGGRAIDGERAENDLAGVDSQPLGTLDRMVKAMLDDVSAAREQDRRFFRYLLLTPHSSGSALLGSEPSEPSETIDAGLARDRLASNELANSLSTESEIAALQAVDDLILRVDLRARAAIAPAVWRPVGRGPVVVAAGL